MAYYEYLRARRSLLIYTAIVVGFAVTGYAIAAFHSKSAIIAVDVHPGGAIPIVIFTSIAAWTTAILASTIAASLNRQREHLAYTWTRPMDRKMVALSLVGVDVAVIVAGFAITMIATLGFLELSTAGKAPLGWDGFARDVLRGIGFALMLYAVVQACSAAVRAAGGTVVGLAWPVFIAAALLEAARFPSPWHEILTIVNLLNPLAYVSGTSVTEHGVMLRSIIPFSEPVRLALMYAITAAGLTIAVTSWKRMEA